LEQDNGPWRLTERTAFLLVIVCGIISLFTNSWVTAIIVLLCAVRYRNYTIAAFKRAFLLLKHMSEAWVFAILSLLWIVAIFSSLWLAAMITVLMAVGYISDYLELVRRGLANEWPYNTAGIIGILSAIFVYPLASIFGNQAIAAITGFHPSFFPNSFLFLTFVAYMFLLAGVLTALSGVLALLDRSNPGTRRVFFISAATVIIGLSATQRFFSNSEAIIDGTEDAILALDFTQNARFETGFYTTKDGKSRMFGTKICARLPFSALLAPHPQGGFILAARRRRAAQFELAALDGERQSVAGTRFVYTYLKQDDCPDIQTYYEYFENHTLRMRSWNYRKYQIW
jgi:hypothetical protein